MCLARVDLPLPLWPSTATKEPLLDLQVHAVQHDGGDALGVGVGEAEAPDVSMICIDRLPLILFSWTRRRFMLLLVGSVQRPVAPQGSDQAALGARAGPARPG